MESITDGLVVVETTYDSPVEKVWKALTDLTEMRKWYFDLKDFKPEVGFEFQFMAGDDKRQWLHLCKVTEVIPNSKISYTWRYDGYPGNSLVSWELFPEGPKTKLVLTHDKLETFLPDQHPELAKKNFEGGWDHFVNKALKEYLEKN